MLFLFLSSLPPCVPDDLFAFIIYTPWLHRLACFRDDLIFFVYLYQRWIYPVDHSRTLKLDEDEDGEGEQKTAKEADKAAGAPSASELRPIDAEQATPVDGSSSGGAAQLEREEDEAPPESEGGATLTQRRTPSTADSE